MLDSIGWSGGNTTLEALAQDLPVVTCQGALMRGRVSAGILRMMGMPETVAETVDDYVALAVRMGRDPAWRAEIKTRIATRQAPALSRPRLHRRAGRFPRSRGARAGLKPRAAARSALTRTSSNFPPAASRACACVPRARIRHG